MNTLRNTSRAGRAFWVVVLVLGLSTLAGTAGCDTTGLYEPGSLGALASWGGLVDPWNTSSLGLPQSPSSYWGALGYGTQNVGTWGGLADPWYTSSLGLPAY
ncbi:MAG TPA: hypothetical protein VLM89_07460 [Phycisphaerae bacterium]|nr:hypothetical protein [Phycisphaerae bacterium]